MLAEDGRGSSLNLASEADPHTQSQETRCEATTDKTGGIVQEAFDSFS
jgi:hypothetical protein